jgi:hypothetical protein
MTDRKTTGDEEPIKDSKEIERKQKKLDERAARLRREKHLRIEGEPVPEDMPADPYKSRDNQ